MKIVHPARKRKMAAMPVAMARASAADNTAVALATAIPATPASEAIVRSVADFAADCALYERGGLR